MPPASDADALVRQREWRAALVTAVSVAVLGVPLGLIWWMLAPRLAVEITAEGPMLPDPAPEAYFASDLTFAALNMVGALLAVGAVVWWGRRYRGPVQLLALTAGVVGAALLGRTVGERLARELNDRMVDGARPDETLDVAVVDLRLQVFIVLPALVSTCIYLVVAVWSASLDESDGPGESDGVEADERGLSG